MLEFHEVSTSGVSVEMKGSYLQGTKEIEASW